MQSLGELQEAKAEALDKRTEIEAGVERLQSRNRAAREAALSYSESILPDAKKALSISRFSLEQGETNLLSWLEARRSYLETLGASYEVLLEAFETRAELERLTGELDASIPQ